MKKRAAHLSVPETHMLLLAEAVRQPLGHLSPVRGILQLARRLLPLLTVGGLNLVNASFKCTRVVWR